MKVKNQKLDLYVAFAKKDTIITYIEIIVGLLIIGVMVAGAYQLS